MPRIVTGAQHHGAVIPPYGEIGSDREVSVDDDALARAETVVDVHSPARPPVVSLDPGFTAVVCLHRIGSQPSPAGRRAVAVHLSVGQNVAGELTTREDGLYNGGTFGDLVARRDQEG